jgi:class 3 adenylate cyclase
LIIHVRTGLHTGECELVGDKITGLAVNIGARIAAEAEPGVPGRWQPDAAKRDASGESPADG